MVRGGVGVWIIDKKRPTMAVRPAWPGSRGKRMQRISSITLHNCAIGTRQMELFTHHTPPNLERLFGYQQSNRWVAFFWGKKFDANGFGYVFDGEVFSPINEMAWDTFFSHPLIVAMNHRRIDGHAVKRFEFGDAHQSSKHWLLMDCSERRLYAGSRDSALVQFNATRPSVDGPHPPPSFAGTAAVQASQDSKGALQVIMEMTAWLDKRKDELEKNGQWPILN
jgi:hypothetical protein